MGCAVVAVPFGMRSRLDSVYFAAERFLLLSLHLWPRLSSPTHTSTHLYTCSEMTGAIPTAAVSEGLGAALGAAAHVPGAAQPLIPGCAPASGNPCIGSTLPLGCLVAAVSSQPCCGLPAISPRHACAQFLPGSHIPKFHTLKRLQLQLDDVVLANWYDRICQQAAAGQPMAGFGPGGEPGPSWAAVSWG